MKRLYFRLEKINSETDETCFYSKILGTPIFKEGFLYNVFGNYKLDPLDYFIMQVNFEEFSTKYDYLPKTGMLYLFINIETLLPKVLYCDNIDDCNLERCDDINDSFSTMYGDNEGYRIVLDEFLYEGHFLFGDNNENIDLEEDIDTTGYITLLEIDYLMLPSNNILNFGTLGMCDGRYVFLIKESDLRKLKFNKVIFVEKDY